MYKILRLLIAIFVFTNSVAHAQNKYAVLLGINDYYAAPGVKHPRSLRGCVNDANAIKELLQNRFLFQAANVHTLFDSNVTKPAVFSLLDRVLMKSRSGDAVVFYFSGHGAWMANAYQLDSVKRSLSQAMVMSNLYASNLDCLLTDEELKKVFNKFVDKKVKVTTLFDCCYSGHLMMMPGRDYWSPLTVAPKVTTRSFNLRDLLYIPETLKPPGCSVDVAGRKVDTLDTDRDGIPDCADWEVRTPLLAAVDSLGISVEFMSADQYIEETESDFRFVGTPTDSSRLSLDSADSRAFNLRDALKVEYRPTALRPSERKNSAFLSLSAATDRELAAEITDEAGIRHGAFTKALLTLYKDNSADLPVSVLLTKITEMMTAQKYNQHPTFHYEKSRLNENLVGLRASDFSNVLTVRCTAVTNTTVTFDKGAYAGLSKGNTLMRVGGKETIQIADISETTSTALNRNGKIKKGDVFKLINPHTVSAALVKLYIPEASFTEVGFSTFFQQKIAPYVAQSDYTDYNFIGEVDAPSKVWLLPDAVQRVKYLRPAMDAGMKAKTIVLLPLPSYIINPLKKIVSKDQNIQLVNRITEADFVLYLNYAKERKDMPAGFVFYYHPSVERENLPVFSAESLTVPKLRVAGKELQALCEKLYGLTKKTVRYKSTAWINNKTRK